MRAYFEATSGLLLVERPDEDFSLEGTRGITGVTIQNYISPSLA